MMIVEDVIRIQSRGVILSHYANGIGDLSASSNVDRLISRRSRGQAHHQLPKHSQSTLERYIHSSPVDFDQIGCRSNYICREV